MSKKAQDCVLCFETIEYIGLGQCNHKEMCFKCHYKMREFTQNRHCPLCNSENMELIVTDDFQLDFEGYSIDHLQLFEKKTGMYALNKEILNELKKLVEIKCFAQGCKDDNNSFQNVANLKKHLKDRHQRNLCDICLEYKTCILSEQKLYTQQQLEKHTKKGDFDEDGNVYFFHPYCNFCLKYFYDEEAIVKHMPDHFTCFVCGPEHKYTYYKNYPNLEKHFKLSHYLCEDKSCLEKCFTVFKTAPELEIHNTKVHNSLNNNARKHTLNQVNLQTMTGFSFSNSEESKIRTKDDVIKDKEGLDFEGQFLSLRKTKMKNTQVDSHSDEPIDYRDFYCQKYDEKYLREESEILQAYYSEHYDEKAQTNSNNQRGSTRDKNQRPKRKQSSKSEEVFQEDIPLLRYHQIYLANEDQIMEKLSLVLDQQKFEVLEEAQRSMTKKKSSAKQFFDIFEGLVGKSIALKLFPVIAASLNSKYEVVQKDMDDVYISEIKKLPSKHKNFINSSETYKQFYKIFRQHVEDQLSMRIRSGKLKLNLKDLKMDRARRFQLIEILRRVKTKEMAKLKFVSNFGVSVEVNQLILRKVFFADLSKVHELLDSIPNHEFLHLFVYVSYCDDLLHGKDIHQEKNSISVNMLKDYFQTHQEIYEKFYPKGENVDENFKEEDEHKQLIGIIQKSTVISKGTSSSKAQQIDTQDIYEFPSMNPSNNASNKGKNKVPQKSQQSRQPDDNDPALPASEPIQQSASVKQPPVQNAINNNSKNIPQQQSQQQPHVKKVEITSNWVTANENPFLYESQDSKIRVNQVLKQEFPTLGGGTLTPFQVPKRKVQSSFPEEEQTSLTNQQKYNGSTKPSNTDQTSNMWGGPGSENVDKHDIANLKVVGKKKGKGGQIQVSLAGYFK